MTKLLSYIGIALFICFSTEHHAALAQSSRGQFSHITTEDGLPQNMVDCMLQDNRGFFWFGTWNGLCRFDGYSFEIFNSTTHDGFNLENLFIYAMHEDVFGNIWIGTGKGLYVYLYDQRSFKLVQFEQTQKTNAAYHAIEKLGKKGLIVGSNIEVSILEIQDSVGNYNILHAVGLGNQTNQIPGTIVNALQHGEKDNVWIGTDEGLYCLDGKYKLIKQFTNNPLDLNSISSNTVVDLYKVKSGELWIGTESGLNRYNKESDSFQRYIHLPTNLNSLPHNTIMNIKEDEENRLIIGTLRGVSIFNPKAGTFANYFSEPNEKKGLNNDFVNCLLIDAQGNIWIGTERGGINVFNKNQNIFEHFEYEDNNPNSISHSTINSIYEDQNHLWIGTAGGGLNRFQKSQNKFVHYRHDSENQKSISSDFITSIHRGSDNLLWIGTWGQGINILRNEGTSAEYFEKYNNENSGIESNFISSIVEDSQGNLWIGSLGGLIRYDQKTQNFESIFTDESEAKIVAVGCLTIDSEDRLWVGTQTGLFHLPVFDYQKAVPGLFKHMPTNKKSLSGDYIISLKSDNYGDMWVGTYGHGLNKIITKESGFQIERYSSKHGINNTIIYGIEEDRNQDLWLSTDYGLIRFDTKKKTSRNLYKTDGLLNNQYYWSASYQNKKGKLYFGGMSGMDAFFPEWISDSVSPPDVTITDIKLVNESVVPNREYNGKIVLRQNIADAPEITLSYKEKVFSIEFSALNYLDSDVIGYSYYLEGFDTKWNKIASPRHFASYTNLKPGTYVFKVTAAGANGVYGQPPTTIAINILPPFWQTWWFKMALIIILFSVIIGYTKYRTFSLKRQKEALEKQVSLRTEEISLQKEALSFQAVQLQKNNASLENKRELIEGQNKQLEGQNKEILSQRDEVIELNKKLNFVSQLKLSFFTNISHEFRTPLTLIIGPLESLLSNLSVKGEVKDTLELMNRNAHRLLHLINEIIEFRKIEKGKIELKVSQGHLSDFCLAIFEAFKPLAEIKKIAFKFTSTLKTTEVWYDAEKIENILYNLLSNAFKYTPNRGTVRMEVNLLSFEESRLQSLDTYEVTSKVISLKIIDSGTGISEENLPLIFKRFYRIESENAFKIGGSGIGLAITEELIKIHHGEIFVSSEPGKGSIFEIQFPCLKGSYDLSERKKLHTNDINIHSQVEILKNELLVHDDHIVTHKKLPLDKNRATVLIVENNTDLRKFIALRLSDHYNIIEAGDGENGLKFSNKYNPDLIVSDVMMPKMDGFELCATIKNNFSSSHIPVILLTAKSSVENQIEGLQIGADDYLPKPFNFELLEVRVRNLIESRKKLKLQFSQEEGIHTSQITSNTKDAAFLQLAVEVVETHISDSTFGSKDLLLAMGISRSLLHKKLISLTNHSASEFINQIRMKQAKQLLKKQNLNISEVAYAVGYNDPKYFSRLFGKHFGQSPKEFQEKDIQAKQSPQ